MSFDLVSRLLFPAPPSSYDVDSFPEELLWVPKSLDPSDAKPEDCIPCIFLPYSSARFLIFYLHSNAEDIGRCYPFCVSVREQFQVHVLAVEYPGYGICPGGPCDERGVNENALAAFRFAHEVLHWPLDNIIILGRSIGCGPAISVATRYQVAGLIVVSPMLSVKEICWDLIGPLSYMMEERFPNKERVPHVRSPLLVVHGQKDNIVPCRHGVELYKSSRSRKLLVCPKEMEHNTNLLADVTYLVLPMLQFFALPDYCFEDIEVPLWAFDKRMSPMYRCPSSSSAPPTVLKGESSGETSKQPFGCLACPGGACAITKPPPQVLTTPAGVTLGAAVLSMKPGSRLPPPMVARPTPPTEPKFAETDANKAPPKNDDEDLSHATPLSMRAAHAPPEVHDRTASRNLLQAVPGVMPFDALNSEALEAEATDSLETASERCNLILPSPTLTGGVRLTTEDLMDIMQDIEHHVLPGVKASQP